MVESMGELEGAAPLWHRANLINSNNLEEPLHVLEGSRAFLKPQVLEPFPLP